MVILAFLGGFLSCGLLMLLGIWVLDKLGMLGTTHPDFNSLEAQYDAQLKSHQAEVKGQLFSLSQDFNKSLATLQSTIQAMNTKPNPFYIADDADPSKRLMSQIEDDYRSSSAAGGI